MAQWPTDEEIVTAVEDAGWLLEHHAIEVLTEAGLNVRASWAYTDPDDPATSRELDVWAGAAPLAQQQKLVHVTATFLVECKQSTKPYVGIGYDLPESQVGGNPDQHVLPVSEIWEPRPDGSRIGWAAWHQLGFHDLAQQHGDSRFRVTQLTRLDRDSKGWSANNTTVFTSLVYPLAKALRASQRPLRETNRNAINSRGDDGKRRMGLTYGLHFPVVLLSCPLYVVRPQLGNEVEQVEWFTAVRELKAEHVQGRFALDFVTKDAFEYYVDSRLRFAEAVAAQVRSDPYKYSNETETGHRRPH